MKSSFFEKIKVPLKVATIYAIFSLLWILFSDRVLESLVYDIATITYLQTVKGWFFILITSGLIFHLLNKELKRRRYLENLFGSMMNSMPSILIAIDRNSKILEWNKAAALEYGNPSAAVRGMKLADVVPSFIRERSLIEKAIESRQVQIDPQITRLKNGEIIYEDYILYPILSDYFDGVVIRIDNVTEIRQMQEVMIQNEKMLSVGGLAAGMAHEINNPLAALMQTLQVAKNRVENMQNKANQEIADKYNLNISDMNNYLQERGIFRMIDTIHSSGARISQIVENMLSFARQETGGKRRILVHELINKTLALLASDFGMNKGYDFQNIKISKELGYADRTIYCDETKLQQVLLNVLKNAAQALHEASVKNPEISIQVVEDQDYDIIRIADNGPGIEDSKKDLVFKPFYTSKAAGIGTGLGLSVSYFIIVDDHGGRFELAEADPDKKGACFSISLLKETTKVHN